MPRQPFGLPHLCIDSHLCRCIVQRLCVAVFMHPCITALCGCLYASLHNGFVRPPSCILCTFMNALLVSHHCLVSRLGCHICASTAICAVASVQWQPFVPLHRATALCGCLYASLLKTLGVHFIRHPCLTRKLRVLAPAAPKSRAMPVCGSGSGAGLSNRACSVGFASCETLGKHYHASLRLRSLGSARPCADSVRQPSCILCTFMNALLVSHRASSAVWVATSCGN